MSGAWVLSLDAVPAPPRALFGVAIGVTDVVADPPIMQLHTGLLHRGDEPDASVELLHLAFHALLVRSPLPDGDVHYVWVRMAVDEDRVEAVVALCRRIWERKRENPEIRFGVIYEGGKFRDDGTLDLGGNAIGLTCATFVLAVLHGAGLDVVDFTGWPTRGDDVAWHDYIVRKLEEYRQRYPDRVTLDHIRGVRAERGCSRLRPEEVAAACAQSPLPARFGITARPGRELRSGLAGGYIVGAILEPG
jgi:hypothetical protein